MKQFYETVSHEIIKQFHETVSRNSLMKQFDNVTDVQIKYNDGQVTDDDISQTSVPSQTPLNLQRPTPGTISHQQQPHWSETVSEGSTSSSRRVLNLGHQPGESDIGYENVAFTRGSGSIDGSVQFIGNTSQYLN